MKIAIGCDHVVTATKNNLVKFLTNKGYEVIDCGSYGDAKTHYAIYGFEVARQVVTKKANLGIVLCGTGIGIANAAQKVKGTRVCLARDLVVVKQSRELYDCNILGMGGNIVGEGLMEAIIMTFIKSKYKGENKATLKKINTLIKKDNYDIHQFDNVIKQWENGYYSDGKKQDKIPLPKTWHL